MIFIDKMKNFKIYKTKTFLPTLDDDKKKGSAILLMTPNYESSKRLLNNDMFVNNRRFASYYLEKDISFYINSKKVEEVDESSIINNRYELDSILETKRSELPDSAFGVPSKRKFPLDTEAHVRSAIKFFNYVDPEDEEELAKRIISAMKKYGIDDVNVSEKNRFSKYYHPTNESADKVIGKTSRILSQLDLYYYGWKNGTIPEATARQKIYDLRAINLANHENDSPATMPTPAEYFSSIGWVTESATGILDESVKRVNDKGVTIPKLCPKCGSKIGLYFKGEPVWLCSNPSCNLYYGTLPFKENDEFREEINRDELMSVSESAINTGDKLIFFNESKANDAQLRRLLYNSRIKYRKDLLNMYDIVKKQNPWIKYTYPDITKYLKKNLFVDLYYYNSIFFENNSWVLKKGMNLYLDFMQRLLNHPNLKAGGYKKKTIFIPISDWDLKHNGSVWNFRDSVNPISCIYNLMYTGSTRLKTVFGDTNVIFVGSDKYFKVNFSEIEAKEMTKLSVKLKLFTTKVCKGEEFDSDDVDSSADFKDDSKVIQAKIADKIELSKGVDITKQLAASNKKMEAELKLSPEERAKNNANVIKKSFTSVTPNAVTSQKNKAAEIKAIRKAIASDSLPDEDDIEIADAEDKESDLDKLADYIATASDDAGSEDDALDTIDNDEVRRILASLGNDSDVNISDSRSARMSKLNNDLLDKEVNGRSVKEILANEENKEPVVTSVDVSAPNKDEWEKLTFINFDKNYDIDKDIVNIFRHFSDCSRPIVIRDINVSDNSTSEDRLNLYDVDMEDYRGKRFRIRLDIPIMEDNRFLLRGNYKSIQTQFFNMPIIKTDLGTCQLISNYKKIFLYRFGDTNGKSLPATAKFIKAYKKYSGNKVKFISGDNTKVCARYHLPIDYIDLAGTFSKIESNDFIIFFNQDEIRSKYAIENKGVPFLFNKKLNAIEYYADDCPITFIEVLCNILFEYCPELAELFSTVTRSSICAYSRASIMSSKIPVVLICGYHIGLSATMDRAGIKYTTEDKISKEIKLDPNKDWIEFNDGYIVYNVDYESSMLMNGLKACSTEMYSLGDIDNKTMYIEFLDNYGGRIKADGLDNFYDLFVDPMIKESLEYYHLPTDYIDILLYGSTLLADNKYVRHIDTSSRRLRRYQLISVYTYQVLSTAYGEYANKLKHNSQAAEFTVKQSAVIDAFLTDTISSDDSCINALRDVETTNAITTKGPSGMNADRAYSLDKRTYDESMVNVLGMSTGFAGNVGITRQTTIDPNITPDGYVKQSDNTKENMNDANSLTATEALIPFVSTRDDPMRTAMSFIQTSKHQVRTEQSDPLLVTCGADEVMPYMTTNKFAYKAKANGIIKVLTEDYIIVQYDDGTSDYVDLKEKIEKNSDGGYFVPLKLDPVDGLKVGKKIQAGSILAYDKYSFSNNLGESDNLAYNIGKLAKVAIINSDEGFEDSGVISASMAEKLATRIDLKYDTVINRDARVFKIAKVGDHIEASDDLIVWQDAFDDEDTEEVIAALSASGDVSDIGKRKLKSDVTGVLKDIKIFRTVELNDLSPSLKKIVSAYEKPLKETAKVLEENGIKSTTKVPAHYVLSPTGKLKRAQDAIIIEFYVEYLDTVGVGDKVVYNAANKAVEKSIFPKGKEPYTDFRPNECIDACVSVSSIAKRLISSTLVYGGLQKLMIELDRHVKDIMEIPYDDSTV